MIAHQLVPQGRARMELVEVATADPMARDVAGLLELGDDPVCGPLCDADGGGDVAQADARFQRNAYERQRVIRQEVPTGFHADHMLLM